MCEKYAALKNDYLYRGDVLQDIPFVILDGKPPMVEHQDLRRTNEWIRPWQRKPKLVRDQDVLCKAAFQHRLGVVMTRTCEVDKLGGKRKLYPYAFVAPIRPLSDFDSNEQTGVDYAISVVAASADPSLRNRFAYVWPCEEHGMERGLICFREMQPVPIQLLVKCEKVARLSIPGVHYLIESFLKFMEQTKRDDETDSEVEGTVSETIRHYEKENKKYLTVSAKART